MVRTDQPGYTDYRLHKLYVYRLNGAVDAYIDSVSLATKPTTNDPGNIFFFFNLECTTQFFEKV
jgi:hypothetical protein